jgi:hypothetical protein
LRSQSVHRNGCDRQSARDEKSFHLSVAHDEENDAGRDALPHSNPLIDEKFRFPPSLRQMASPLAAKGWNRSG